jgi:hypothetical protein
MIIICHDYIGISLGVLRVRSRGYPEHIHSHLQCFIACHFVFFREIRSDEFFTLEVLFVLRECLWYGFERASTIGLTYRINVSGFDDNLFCISYIFLDGRDVADSRHRCF